jgi:hypothetical protein
MPGPVEGIEPAVMSDDCLRKRDRLWSVGSYVQNATAPSAAAASSRSRNR